MKWTDDTTSGVSSERLAGWRPAWEVLSAAAAAAGAGVTAGFCLGAENRPAEAVTGALGCLALWRAWEGWRVCRARFPLGGMALDFMDYRALARKMREMMGKSAKEGEDGGGASLRALRFQQGRAALTGGKIFSAKKEGARVDALWLGRGFVWTPSHAQALSELTDSPLKAPRLPLGWYDRLGLHRPLDEKAIGSPLIHGVGAADEADIVRPLGSLGGGMLIVGTTQAGKGVMLTNLISQAIYRGDPVIVIDPKSSKRLRESIFQAAKACGRTRPLEFHPAFPETGVRLDPLGAWTRPTEIATRIAAVLPPDSGAFGAFAWNAVNVAVEGLFYVTERPTLLGLRQLLENGIDRLLEKALRRSFAEEGIKDWEALVKSMDPMSVPRPTPQASYELCAMVLLWETKLAKRHNVPEAGVIGGLITTFRHNREHYAKITASLQPVLAMLTAGTLAKSFSPDPFDATDDRPIVTVERVIDGGDILYLGLDALPDSTVAGALGSIILADLTAYAGKRYNRGESGTKVERVSLFVDETANVINPPMIDLLNKGMEAGIHVTAAMQTVSDLAARLGNENKARMALGNFNNLIALRSKDRATQEFITETFGKAMLWQEAASISSSADGNVLPEFRASVTRSLSGHKSEIVPPEILGRLPNTEFFASVSGGRIFKGRMPILVDEVRQ